MIVTFDTNVLISAAITPNGLAESVLRRSLGRHQVILSTSILTELEKNLSKKAHLPQPLIQFYLDFFNKYCAVIPVETDLSISFKDKTDLPVLSFLQTCKPHYLITGDKALLNLKKFGPTAMISPREAVEML